jgi:hypothetical protein
MRDAIQLSKHVYSICIILAGILFLYFWYNRTLEGLTGSPYDEVQKQVGTIQALHTKIEASKQFLNDTHLSDLQNTNSSTSDDINTLQANIPPAKPIQY